MIIKVSILVFCLGVFFTTSEAKAKIKRDVQAITTHPRDQWFLDEYNRVRIFHGVNSVSKGFPWYRADMLDDDHLDLLQSWGLNIIRLGTMWTGTEPTEGFYNGTYINILRTIVEKLGERGIYTMLDMHQDCLSSKYPPSYDGVPRWLVDSFPEPTNPYPWPLDEVTQWEEGYLTQGVSEGFQHLYNNTNNALDKWADFWEFIAFSFNDLPSVIGYNYINEPWVGDYFQNEDLLLPGVAGQQNLLPVYDVLTEKIREVDQKKIIFYEPVFHGQLIHDLDFGSGFDRVPGGEKYKNVSAFSYHMYCWSLEFISSNATDEERQEAKEYCERELLPTMMNSALENANLTGGASMLTEYGICKTFEDTINVECDFFMDLCDQRFQSWIDWDYNDNRWFQNGQPIMERVIEYVRPYPQAIAGTPIFFSFISSELDFILEFTPDASIEQPTEIYVPSIRYVDGYDVEVSPSLTWEAAEGDIILVYYNGSGQPNSQSVRITPKA